MWKIKDSRGLCCQFLGIPLHYFILFSAKNRLRWYNYINPLWGVFNTLHGYNTDMATTPFANGQDAIFTTEYYYNVNIKCPN